MNNADETSQTPVYTMANPDSGQKILILSIPKCGTYLLKKLIRLLTGKQDDYREAVFGGSLIVHNVNQLHLDNKFTHDHLPHSNEDENILKANNIKTFFLYRDPRDCAVSFSFYVAVNEFWNSIAGLSFEERLLDLIEGDRIYSPLWPGLSGIEQFYRAFLPWRKNPEICTVKFENLVGPSGGGSLSSQLDEMANIVSYLGYTVSADELMQLSGRLFGDTPTFRRGRIGGWRDYFSTDHTTAFKRVAPQLLVELGYEADSGW